KRDDAALEASGAARAAGSAAADDRACRRPSAARRGSPSLRAHARSTGPSPGEAALGLYLAGAIALSSRSALGWMLARRIVHRSRAVHRRVRESGDIVVPVAAGLLRPAVLLPSNWREWSRETRAAVLAHEFAHIRRADAWTAMLARVAVSLLWFHPLVWWLSRKTSELAELACDAEALDRVGDPAAYSRILVQFAGQVVTAGHRAALPGLAMADSSTLSSRIDQVFDLADAGARGARRPLT